MANLLTKNDLTVLKSLTKPPALVKELMVVTMLLLGYSEKESKEWKNAQRLLGKAELLQEIKEHDANKISQDTIVKAKEFMDKMTYERVNNVSAAATSLYVWANKVVLG